MNWELFRIIVEIFFGVIVGSILWVYLADAWETFDGWVRYKLRIAKFKRDEYKRRTGVGYRQDDEWKQKVRDEVYGRSRR